MTISVSSDSLKDQRSALVGQRRLKTGQAIWRFFFLMCLAGGVGWMMTLSTWKIEKDSQVEVKGLQLMSQKTLRSLLLLSYPQSLWRLPTHQLSQQLENKPPVARALVTRHLFPPKIVIEVKERQPIAVASSNRAWGYLDEEGVFIPQKFYNLNQKGFKTPTLKVLGYNPNYRNYWLQLYPLIHDFPLQIFAIDWQDYSNLVLVTELGNVHLGDYTTQLAKKLSILGKMRHLSEQIPKSQIVYIDVSNPDSPVVQLKQQPKSQSLNSLVKKE
ncbi:cell division protein FtsQ [Aphanothece hegewaldii CCALA 016]|uniref:Cell division protein FtsQ n=1 Tax=Aphanothece hegewaldii CCALA 016 TaxID=2107694 RepID=A0A2T1LS41_9CHRO|nr:FtsQ-type POTRA domain-containing protein [Aphanothece hegewaldii]PSF32251.1 cell division protein FtsQ [Aphanothece hegewaldii CCALA 016]